MIIEESFNYMSKQNKITTASILFLAVVILHIIGVLKSESLAFFTKPFLMICLVIIYLVSVKKANFWFVSALFFSFWGDVLLLFKEQFFVFGLASFLLAHIFYIKITSVFIKKISLQKVLFVSLPFVLFVALFITLIIDDLGEMLLPVIFYAVVISSFGAIALVNYLQEKSTANLWLFLGAIIFITSDSLIAINKFYSPNELFQLCIMLTYIVAQYLICKAVIAKNKD